MDGIWSPGAYFASHLLALVGWAPGPPHTSNLLLLWSAVFWSPISTMSPERSGQTNSDFQQGSEEIKAVPAQVDSKNQWCKDPDLPPSCPALRDS